MNSKGSTKNNARCQKHLRDVAKFFFHHANGFKIRWLIEHVSP